MTASTHQDEVGGQEKVAVCRPSTIAIAISGVGQKAVTIFLIGNCGWGESRFNIAIFLLMNNHGLIIPFVEAVHRCLRRQV